MLPDKWQFDTSQDWEILEDNFDSISLDTILNSTLQALSFYISFLGYLKEGVPQFVAVIDDPDLTIKLVDNGQPITDFEDKKVRKQNEYAAKKKAPINNLCVFLQVSATGSAALLLFCFIPVSFPGSPASLLSCPRSPTCLLPLFACLETLTALSSHLVSAPVPKSPAVLLLLPVLSPVSSHLTSIALKTFKQALSNKRLRRRLTSPAKLFYLFLLFDLLPNKTDCKQTFDTTYINSRLFAGNYA